ncbi:MAG: YfhO family protein [Acidobacteriota bacterium]|nr:MAG: YfhO family protein [Acidobacteriota bacterium]
MNNPTQSTERRAGLVVAVIIFLLPLIYFYPALTGEVALAQGDGWTQNLGVRVLIGRMIGSGQAPLWNPYIFAGTPLLASIYPGALYPPNWLFAIFSPGAAMNLVVITTYHLALIGTYLFGRRLGMSRTGALVAGAAFTFGGYMIAHLGHTSRIAAAAWLPWILLAIENLYRRFSWRWVSLGALFIALQQFAGEPQMTFYTVLLGGSYWLFCLFIRPRTQSRISFLATSAAMAICGTLLSMMQLLPQRELLKQGERAQIAYEYFSAYSLPPRQALTFLFPYFFGGAAKPPYQIVWWGQWTVDETCGYVGLMTLLLGLIALIGRRRERMVWFWAAMAAAALVMAFGAYLPFGVWQVFHRIPVFNLFRASARHMFEFTFCLSILAGMGASGLMRAGIESAKKIAGIATAVLATIMAVGAMIYLFLGDSLVAELPRSPLAGSLSNPEVWIPLLMLLVTSAAVWFGILQLGPVGKSAIAAVLLLDLMVFGHFFNWRVTTFSINERVVDSPPVKFIKSREKDLASFRIISHSPRPFAKNYDGLNYPNVSIARGLQSVNGYDALRLVRTATLAGDMSIDGLVTDPNAFGTEHRGFDLLNVKYLLRERPADLRPEEAFVAGGISFFKPPKDLQFKPGTRLAMPLGGVSASEIALISNMANSTPLPDGTAVLRIRLLTSDGRSIERDVQAGRDTAEWAYDRPDVRAVIKHSKPQVAESLPADGFNANRYLGRLPFERSELEQLEMEYLLPEALLAVMRVSFYDAETGKSYPIDPVNEARSRWKKLETFGEVSVYENLTHRSRAWFVRRAAVELSRDIPSIIRSGRMRDGSIFDPAETALLEREDFGGREIILPEIGDPAGASVNVTKYEPHRIELRTMNPQPGFLVLSEVYYRGWDARIDGRPVPVERVDYALRGIAVPKGDHRIEFIFRAPSFRNGAIYSMIGLVILAAGAVIARFSRRP